MSKSYCVVCQKEVESQNWKHRKWGEVEGWGCQRHFKVKAHEFTTEAIKEERFKYKNDITQPFREGEFSQEFRDTQPEVSKEMIKSGSITQEQHDNAKPVWKGDVEGW